MIPARPRFPGLDSLRFWAAFLVILDHVPITQESRGLPHPTFGAVSFRGAPAVSFFFALSGFLITFLLLDERLRRGGIDVRAFYVRRALRIWPLYFLVTAFGILFYKLALPALGIAYATQWPAWGAAVFYLPFLPALFNSLYSVGGLLNPLWSIGVEEQFYLSWAPTVRRHSEHLIAICLGVLVASLALSAVNELNLLGLQRLQKFVGQLEFHFMAAGALAAVLLRQGRGALLERAPFRCRPIQVGLWVALIAYVLLGPPHGGPILEEVLQLALYVWLIVETAANPSRLVRLDLPATEWLGGISYGLYLFHMFAVYAVAYFFMRTRWWLDDPAAYGSTFYGAVLALTVLLSYLSHRLFEAPMLRLKRRFTR